MSDLMLVGESYGASEELANQPFVGVSGQELTRMLAEANIRRVDCFATNVVNKRPPNNEIANWFGSPKSGQGLINSLYPNETILAGLKQLIIDITREKPKLILAFGNYALWALTDVSRMGKAEHDPSVLVPTGISDFRGSMLYTRSALSPEPIPVLPLLHPAAIMRAWELRTPTVHDLRTRVPKALLNNWKSKTKPIIVSAPSFREVEGFLSNTLTQLDGGRIVWLANDIETRQSLITCMCFATSPNYAVVIPLINKIGDQVTSYWSSSEEVTITRLLRRLLPHPNVRLIGQNYTYDMTYLKAFYGVVPNCGHDTMSAQHLIWPGTQKDLGYLSSIYCEYHRYWKDDNKEWDAKGKLSEHFLYNGEDGIRTFEIHLRQLEVIKQLKIEHLWEKELLKHRLAFSMSSRGVRMNMQKKAELSVELGYASQQRVARLLKLVPQSLIDERNGGPTYRKKLGQAKQQVFWPSSTTQQKTLFYDILGMSGQTHRKTRQPTLDKEALPKLKKKYPWAQTIFDILLELRSINVFASTFVNARVDPDGRMRTSFNPAGTETFRWSSSTNAFGTGCNFQNLPKGKDL